MNRRIGLAVVLLSSMALACGDDSESEGDGGGAQSNGQVNEAAAQGNATQTITGSKTAISGDGLAAAYQLASLGTSALSLVQPAGQAGPQSEGQAKQAVQVGTCDCTDTQCTFVGCSDDAYPNPFTIDGTLSWGGGHVVADLTYTGSAAAATYDFHLTMDVTVTDTTIDGTVGTDGSVQSSGYGTTWESSLDMNGITFNASGCPTAGTLDVDASVDGPSTADYSATTTITFDGTGC